MTALEREAGRELDAAAISRATHAFAWLWMRRRWNRLRLSVATVVLGRGWFAVITTLLLVRERALKVITPDGGVILAECASLSDALYTAVPGRWRLTIELLDDAASAPQTTEEET